MATTTAKTWCTEQVLGLRARHHRISGWDPEDVAAWRAGGAKIARRRAGYEPRPSGLVHD